ncbi:helix-turn-helix transcriptional regulator [Micromonospora sp. S-DT3-3-22]|uniref:helix-turn-helix domain-containing protein n=1 Tax=Micromonospora sp. S-DT3-3-22 TaxID=2755359 RepID=UPI00188ECB11|nr:helix-turn-helix transcriptional regulator [Micromonospora sp. S-DT3-3-22]
MLDAAQNSVPQAATAVEYVGLLRDLRRRSGLTYREISRRASAAGHWLPPSTLATMLGRTTLPRERTVVALLAACGTPAAAIDQWVGLRRDIDVRLGQQTRWDSEPMLPEPAAPDPALFGVRLPAVNQVPPRRPATTTYRATRPDGRQLRLAATTLAAALAVGAYGVLRARRRPGRSSDRGGCSTSGPADLEHRLVPYQRLRLLALPTPP